MSQERFESAKEAVGDRVDAVKDAMSNVQPADNPMLMLLGGLAVGFVVGMLVPVSRFENENLGPVADDLKSRARKAGAHAARRGSEVIKESIEAAAASS